MLSFFTDHLLWWFLLFVVGLTVSSACGVNPLVMTDRACEKAVTDNSFKKTLSYVALGVAILGEYAFFIGLIIFGVRYFTSWPVI